MDRAELKGITSGLNAITISLKRAKSAEMALKGNLGTGSADGVAIGMRDLQAALQELITQTKTLAGLIGKPPASTTAPALPSGTNRKKEADHLSV